LVDLFSDHGTTGKKTGQAKDKYWQKIKDEKRYIEIGKSVFYWTNKGDMPKTK
jgi:hypothetical protein